MIQACLNGDRTKRQNPAVPVTVAELSAEAVAACAAGASALHLHPRGGDGAETLAPELVAACLAAVRAAVPGVPVGVGTSVGIAPGGAARLRHIAAWETLPDYASVNLNEPDAPENMALMRQKGIGIEAGIWTLGDAERFVALPHRDECLRILIEVISPDPDAARAEYHAITGVLDGAGVTRPRLLHGLDGSAWAMIAEAGRDGLDTRIGLEDALLMPDGTPAPGNAAMVTAARALYRA
ncbi:3-keto-5-aminohexanoate cleavage protein [Acuticoccus sp. MNP-M23]|uniref:3-keto-5-aminohexanoate cleavage protein n=1 Tax=Acuticoccus sp. MNP-M23 TaxID=3072793 RepID=UPI0028169ACE|nr:3-keto-5-aminohexanoate cleavage protein [Acuticoccus sp. MNP-M23]WMS44122.1 3-keto-5-aminohexanoate cleavage protein [Acuticoccus sp. MNP-M23]